MVSCKHYFAYLIQIKNLTLKTFNFAYWQLFDRSNIFRPNEHFSQNFESSLEVQRAKRKFSDNTGHNILELYNILVQIRFTTSKRKLDIQYRKLGIRVALRVAEWLNTQDLRKLGHVKKISNLGGDIAQCLVFLRELRLFEQQLKNTQKQIPKLFFPVQFYWITPFCSKYFVWDCSFQYSQQS